jgi:hypothetical protein
MAGTAARYEALIDALWAAPEPLTCRNSGLKAILCERWAQWMGLTTRAT